MAGGVIDQSSKEELEEEIKKTTMRPYVLQGHTRPLNQVSYVLCDNA